MNYIFDGEIHPLSKDYAYIIQFVDQITIDENDLSLTLIRDMFFKKYQEYLSKNNENLKEENFSFIYRPSTTFEMVSQKGTIALKFKRFENDGLDND